MTIRRALALLLLPLTFTFTACPRQTADVPASFVQTTAEDPDPTPTPYEDPAECKCYVINGKKVCNSACP